MKKKKNSSTNQSAALIAHEATEQDNISKVRKEIHALMYDAYKVRTNISKTEIHFSSSSSNYKRKRTSVYNSSGTNNDGSCRCSEQ